MHVKTTPRTIFLAAAALAVVAAPLAVAAVKVRNLAQQLEWTRPADGGRVVYGEILSAREAHLPDAAMPFTRMTVKVEKDLLQDGKDGNVVLFAPGFGHWRLSITPPESEMRAGEKVLFFARKDAGVSSAESGALLVDSFAEAFRTQLNRKGQIVVLGEGHGSAVPDNIRLDTLTKNVRALAPAGTDEQR